METKEDVQADIDRMLDGRSIEDIERELDAKIEQENQQKSLTNGENSDIIKEKGRNDSAVTTTQINADGTQTDLSQYIGQPIPETDNQHVREWYYANVSNIPNQLDKSKTFEEQVRQAFELRNQYKHQARIAMSDKRAALELEKEHPAPKFDELLQRKMERKHMSREEALEDILRTASKTNPDVNKEFGL